MSETQSPDEVPAASETRGGADTKRRGSRALPIVIIVVALALVGGWFGWKAINNEPTSGGSVPVWSPTPSSNLPKPSSVKPKPTQKSSAPPAPGCMATPNTILPTKFTIDDLEVESPVLSLGTDDSGAPAAPPKDQPRTVGWWNRGPKVGANKGNAILTIHTYRQGGALGNQLNSEKGLKPGMVVRLIDESGKAMCYTYERAVKIWVKDYDPNSTVLYDDNGKPQAVIVICWDFNKAKEDWDSRILFYLKPMV